MIMKKSNFTCADYREEMMLVELKKKMTYPNLTPEEKKAIGLEIEEIEKKMGIF